jgi:hypothetical protein
LISAGSDALRRGFLVLAWLIDWLPVFIMGVFSRASRLPLARRLEYLERLERARVPLLAALLSALKIPLAMIVYETGPELQITGFDRPSVSSRRLPVAPVVTPLVASAAGPALALGEEVTES